MHLFRSRHVTPSTYRFFVAAQLVFLCSLVLHATFIPLFYFFGVFELMLFNSLSVIVFSSCLYFNYKGLHSLTLWLAFVEVTTHAALSVYFLGWNGGFAYYLLLAPPLMFLYNKMPEVQKIVALIFPAVLFIVLHQHCLSTDPIYFVDETSLTLTKYFNIIATMSVLAYLAYFYSNAAASSEARAYAASLKLEEMATTDALTSLLNRRALDDKIKREVDLFLENGCDLVFALGDIDNFKQVNDQHGHLNGDIVLKQVAKIMKSHFRADDLVVRWGGEEFLILLVGADIQQAEAVTELVRKRIETTVVELDGAAINVTITFGLCAFNRQLSIDECLQHADQGLYKGKNTGKNCVVTIQPAAA